MKVKEPNRDNEVQTSLKANKISDIVQSEPNYGPWMVVTRKKGSARMGKASGLAQSNISS